MNARFSQTVRVAPASGKNSTLLYRDCPLTPASALDEK